MKLLKDLGVCALNGKSIRHYGIWQCPKCINTITTTFSKINSRTHSMCKKCAIIEAFTKRRLKQEQTFIIKAKTFHKEKYTYEKVQYINNHVKVIITCPIHGDFKQTPSSHYKHGCDRCRSDSNRKSVEQFIENSIKTHGKKYNYSEVIYSNGTTPVKINCKNCRSFFTQRPNDHLNGSGCPICNKGSDLDLIYIWKITNTNIYKFGVTSSRLGNIRINQVVASLRKNGYVIEGIEKILHLRTNLAKEIESYLHNKYTIKPNILPQEFDGKTEFRVLTELEELEITQYIKDTYAISEII